MDNIETEKLINKYIIDVNDLSKIDLTIAPKTSKSVRSIRKLNHNRITMCYGFDNQFSPAMIIYAKILMLQKLNTMPIEIANKFDIEYGICNWICSGNNFRSNKSTSCYANTNIRRER